MSSETLPKIPDRYLFDRRLHPERPIYAALDHQTGAAVAIKFDSPKNDLIEERESHFRERLLSEATILRRWSHCPNVIRLLDSWLDHSPPFLVLERLGTSMEQFIPPDGVSLDTAITAARDIAVALASIHATGTAHYDVKPDNILLNPATGRWTLIDPGAEDTRTEDFSSHLIGWEADVLSLGRTLIVLLSATIDTDLVENIAESIENEVSGDEFLKLLRAMLWHPRMRGSKHSVRPSAKVVIRTIDKIIAERARNL